MRRPSQYGARHHTEDEPDSCVYRIYHGSVAWKVPGRRSTLNLKAAAALAVCRIVCPTAACP